MTQFSQFCAHSNLIQVLIKHLKVASSSSDICSPSGVLVIRRELTEARLTKQKKILARHISAGLSLYQLKIFFAGEPRKDFFMGLRGSTIKSPLNDQST